MKYDLVDYFDVWGNEEDGFDVNNLAIVEEDIYIDDDFTDEEIFEYLRDNIGYFKKYVSFEDVYVDDIGDYIEFEDAKTGEPICRLQPAQRNYVRSATYYNGLDMLSDEDSRDVRNYAKQRIASGLGKTTELIPSQRQKSFYGKAIVTEVEPNHYVLTSYGTDVAEVKDGEILYADYGTWSATTNKHIAEFLNQYCPSCNGLTSKDLKKFAR